jgi:putative nucleotidyltransferase with HDIG domain
LINQPGDNDSGKKKTVLGNLTNGVQTKSRKLGSKLSWAQFDRPRNRLILLAILAICVGVVLTPGLSSKTRSYDDSWIGQVSNSDIRSPADYNVQDKEATESKREEAERLIYPVYDYDAQMGPAIQKRLDLAFSDAQNIIYTFIIENIAALEGKSEKTPEANGAKQKRKKPASEDEDKIAPPSQNENLAIKASLLDKIKQNIDEYFSRVQAHPDLNENLKTQVLSARNDFNKNLQAVISEDDYIQLFQFHFSDDLLSTLKQVIGDVMAHKIIADKELMEKGPQGQIAIRMLETTDESPTEYLRRDVSGILDFSEVNQSLWRYSSALNDLGKRQQELLWRIGAKLVQPNLIANRALSLDRRRVAREAVKPMFIPIKKGEMIIRDGERFEKRHLTILRGIEQELSATNPVSVLAGYTLLFFAFIAIFVTFGVRNIRKFSPGIKDLVMLVFLTILFIVLVKVFGIVANALNSVFPYIDPQIYYIMLPVAAGAAMVRIVLNSETAAFYSIFIGLLFGLLTSQPFFMTTYAIVTGLVAADAVGQCRTRATLFLAGLRVSLIGMLLVTFQALLTGTALSVGFIQILLAALAAGIGTGLALSAMTPIIEFIFSYTTDIKLLELANLNHPLLKQLIVQAPGTYHHSIIVGSLVEAAAESIHANPLLARVAAYYHDIGKIKTPLYFGENQPDQHNPHDSLSPSMSVLILQSHVKEGVELARQHNLGEKITSIIGQHHGTSLIRFFHAKASEMKAQGLKVSDDENEFRYPGPKPQTREAGLVMLADSAEAASRSLREPSAERIQGLVQKIINAFFRDGQLNECELTLKDLHQIARAFTKILVGIHHNRPQYPDAKQAQEKSTNGRSNPQSAKKTPASGTEMEAEDDEDLKRLGMH